MRSARFKIGITTGSDMEKAVALFNETDMSKEQKICFSGFICRAFGIGFLYLKKRKADERSRSD
jgi:hypothetical protein